MTPKEIAEALDNNALAFLHNVGARLTQGKIFIETPRRMWDEANQDFEWWLLVYPWARTDRPPDNALTVAFRLILESGGTEGRLMVELERVDGTWVDDLDESESIPLEEGIRGFKDQMSFFEHPDTIHQVASRSAAYIEKARREHPEGPREWSPRMRGSELGAKKKEEPMVVNLVEEKEWKDNWTWESTDFDERMQNLQDEYYRALFKDKDECEGLIEEILGIYYSPEADEGPREWTPRGGPVMVGPDGLKKACKAWYDHKLEAVDHLIRDTIQFMYEEAMIPDDEDIKYAIEETQDKYVNDPDLDDEIWDRLIDRMMKRTKTDAGKAERSIMLDLMNQVNYTREQAHYDRYIEFELMNAQLVTDLIHEWPVEDRSWVEDTLRFREFKNLRERFLEDFFERLKKILHDSDPDNRTDWKKHWTQMLKDKKRIDFAREKIWEYLRTAPELPEEVEE